ncbi:MAG: diguanylate cyclase [Thiotrichaceae bacterium]
MFKFLHNNHPFVVLFLATFLAIIILFRQAALSDFAYLSILALTSLLLGGVTVYWALRSKIDRLTKLSNTDKVTGLYNSEVIDKLLNYDIERSKRYQRDLSVVLLDVDNYEQIIDTYGQKKADETLKFLSHIIMQGIEYVDKEAKEFHGIRGSDIAFRYAGEDKILIIMSETSAKGAYVAAERIREAVMFTPFNEPDVAEYLRVTLSAGVVSFDHEIDTAETLLQRANLLLLKAKITKNHVAIENPIHHGLVVFDDTDGLSMKGSQVS